MLGCQRLSAGKELGSTPSLPTARCVDGERIAHLLAKSCFLQYCGQLSSKLAQQLVMQQALQAAASSLRMGVAACTGVIRLSLECREPALV